MLQPGMEVAFATDSQAHEGAVLLAIAKPDWCCVFTISKAEYDLDGALALGSLFGFHKARPLAAIARARKGRR
jgi:hypothetical protein